MFSTSSIIDNFKEDETIECKRLYKLLKISKKIDKTRLNIALKALEELEIIGKNEKGEFYNMKSIKHIKARIRCSSKGYCFAVRDDSSEDIYIKENLLNYAWNGDKVLVRILKEGFKRRSPEGVVDCILERSNKILLAKVQLIEEKVYGIPIDDRILARIRLPEKDKKYIYDNNLKNIVRIEIDMFPIGDPDGLGHVINELNLQNNEDSDNDFVLSKNNINPLINNKNLKIIDPDINERLDLTSKKCFMMKSWEKDNCPLLPLFHVDNLKNGEKNLWIHTNSIAERIDFCDKNIIDSFLENFETLPLINDWKNFLDKNLIKRSIFEINKDNNALSLCIKFSEESEIIDWSFHLTRINCKLILNNQQLEALLNRKSKARITSRVLKPIKEFIEDIDYLLDLSKTIREKYLNKGKFEISKDNNNIELIKEFYKHIPGEYSNEYFEPLNINDVQTYISPLLLVADKIWFEHSKNYKLNSIAYHSRELNHINVNEIIKQSQIIDNNFELNDNGSITLNNLFKQCDDNKKRIIYKNLPNNLNFNKATIYNENEDLPKDLIYSVSPWTLPSLDLINLINQYSIINLFRNAKKSNKNIKEVNIFKKDSWNLVKWKILNASNLKSTNILFDKVLVDKFNDFKIRTKTYRSNMINIKKIREAEKLINNVYKGLILTVQSYGFFVELPDIFIEGLVHVSTLNDDWYEYRSRQNLLVGRKSKNTFSVGDLIDVKIMKVDILKYQVDLEIA